MAPLLAGRDLAVLRGGRAILDAPEVAIHPGEILAVLGPNGAGKSTLLLVLGLLLEPDRGEVLLHGRPVGPEAVREARRKLACAFQSPLLIDRTVGENAELGLRLRGVRAVDRRLRADRWLERLGLVHLRDRRIRTLSGGEAQRLNLARALALEPDVLLLDEPLSALDAPSRAALSAELVPLVRQGAGGSLVVTHDRQEAFALGSRVLLLFDGRPRQTGTPEEVFSRPADVEVARFLGFENLLPGRASGPDVDLGGGMVLRGARGPDGEIVACIRAEEIRVLTDRDPAAGLGATLASIEPGETSLVLRLDAGLPLVARASRAEVAALGLSPGSPVRVHVRPEAVHRVPRSGTIASKRPSERTAEPRRIP
ncbi:MAG TPA: ABC transporter ATP-binding protein [Polyangia bacterium]|nr:ABC transporter ATP-binding protein [Polyangia bacterium]